MKTPTTEEQNDFITAFVSPWLLGDYKRGVQNLKTAYKEGIGMAVMKDPIVQRDVARDTFWATYGSLKALEEKQTEADKVWTDLKTKLAPKPKLRIPSKFSDICFGIEAVLTTKYEPTKNYAAGLSIAHR